MLKDFLCELCSLVLTLGKLFLMLGLLALSIKLGNVYIFGGSSAFGLDPYGIAYVFIFVGSLALTVTLGFNFAKELLDDCDRF